MTDKTDMEFLHKILALCSPTGGEQNLQRFLCDWAKPFAGRIETDRLGNLAIIINPEAKRRVMLAAHADQIGFMITGITCDGFLRVDSLGGIDEATVLGARVTIRAQKGPVKGVFGKSSTHLQSKEERDAVPTMDQVWIDIGVRSREEAEKLVAVGDYATYVSHVTELAGSRIAAPALDNMLGVYAVMQTARICAERGIDVALYCVTTVQEEIGTRGARTAANSIDPDVAIAIDTSLATDVPTKPSILTKPELSLDAGPSILRGPNASPLITRRLIDTALKGNIPYQLQVNTAKAGNDAKELQLAGRGAATGSVGVPLRNMHTQVEIASMEDVNATIDLLVEFVCGLDETIDFMPLNYDFYGDKVSSLEIDGELGALVNHNFDNVEN